MKWKVKDGQLEMLFPVGGMDKEDIEYLRVELERAYKITSSLIMARKVLK